MSSEFGAPLTGAQYDVPARLAGEEQAGFGEVAESKQETFAADVVLASARAAEAERGRRHANGEFLTGFVDMMPRCGYERSRQGGRGSSVVYADSLATVKRVQSSVLWHPLDGAGYVVGSNISDRPKFTQLLLARPTYYDGERGISFSLGRVYTEDYRQWQILADTALLKEYTHEQVQALAGRGKSLFVAAEDDPHSTHLRGPYLSGTQGPVDWVAAALIRQARPNFMIKPNVPRWGVRMRGDFDFNRIDPYMLDDKAMELFGVFDKVSRLAQKFGKGSELTHLHKTWQEQHGGIVL